MPETGTEKTVIVHSGDGGVSGALIAVVLLLILVVAGVFIYRSGFFGGGSQHEIDININKPGAILLLR